MILQQAIADGLGEIRREAEARMLDTFTAYSPDGITEDDDGFEVPVYAAAGATPGRIAGPNAGRSDTEARTVTIGGTEHLVVSAGLHIPLSSPVPAMGEYGFGWEYVLTELGPLTDPALLNSRWLVVDSPAKSIATARRLDVVRL